MKTYIRPQTIKLHMLTERGFLYNSPTRDVGAKQCTLSDNSIWDENGEESGNVSQWPKQKSLWDD